MKIKTKFRVLKKVYHISDIQIRLEELEENSHPPVDWEEIIHANTQRIEYLERRLSEREPQ